MSDGLQPISMGVVGAGMIAKMRYLPILKKSSELFRVAAAYSRTQKNALSAAKGFAECAVIDDLNAILTDPRVPALLLLLPPNLQAEAIRTALDAGKHVLSEKPIGADTATAHALVKRYAQNAKSVWMVAENWRFEPFAVAAHALVQSNDVGPALAFSLMVNAPMTILNPFFHSVWRTKDFGFLIDTGVHHVALLRRLFGDVARVTAQSKASRANLPEDILVVTLEHRSGVMGQYCVSYAPGPPLDPELQMLTEKFHVRVNTKAIEISGAKKRTIEVPAGDAFRDELAVFANAIRGEPADPRAHPLEALNDLATMLAIVESAKSGQRQDVEQFAAT
jgi:predicted dehydrogenase